MTECKFRYDNNKQRWICTVCGRTINAPKTNTVHATCRKPINIVRQAVNYTKAVATHIATGMKTRTDEEVAARLQICQSCESFNADKGYCTKCGCRCNSNQSAFTNKIRMKTQKCPEGKWE